MQSKFARETACSLHNNSVMGIIMLDMLLFITKPKKLLDRVCRLNQKSQRFPTPISQCQIMSEKCLKETWSSFQELANMFIGRVGVIKREGEFGNLGGGSSLGEYFLLRKQMSGPLQETLCFLSFPLFSTFLGCGCF